MLFEVNLAPQFLQMEVPIEVVLHAQNAFLALIRAEDDITACGPFLIGHECKTPIVIHPQTALLSFRS